MSNPDRPRSRDLAFDVAQLRHAYAHLRSGSVRDQKEFAEGLLSPIIASLEKRIEENLSAQETPILTLPEIPDEDADFSPDIARKIIGKYREIILRMVKGTPQ